MVAETEAIALRRVCPVGTVPWKVNGIEMVNWPPNACEAVPRNQTFETGWTLTANWVVGRLNPAAGVSWMFHVPVYGPGDLRGPRPSRTRSPHGPATLTDPLVATAVTRNGAR